MSKIRTFFRLASSPSNLVRPLVSNNYLKWLPDKKYYEIVYKATFGHPIDWKNPRTFNEKLQWLKLYNRKPEFTMMADKYAVRTFVKDRIGEEYLVPLIGKWDDAKKIDFSSLPNQFVLKCNHDQGSVIICTDKQNFDAEAARKKLSENLKKNHYWRTREWPYKNIKPCIIGEKYLQDGNDKVELSDYKVLCFNGEPKLIEVHRGRFGEMHTQDFYDINWKKTEFNQPDVPSSAEEMERPDFADKMFELSKKLSKGIEHIRVDWYYTNNRLYFSELTFYDASGFDPFKEGQDKLIGDWLTLPKETTVTVVNSEK